MKKLLPVFAALLFLVSCNNTPKATEEKPVAMPAEEKPAFKEYKARFVKLEVKDFDKWYAGFNMHDSLRKAYGLTDHAVGQGHDNDKLAIVFSNIEDERRAKEYDNSAERKKNMKAGGITKPDSAAYWAVLMDDTIAIPQKDRLMVSYHVKDFDGWKKAADAEGKATRAQYGMVDRLVARGLDDPNMVMVIFAITDMDKAKARTTSPEMKKLEADAGVDGKPEATWFKWVKH